MSGDVIDPLVVPASPRRTGHPAAPAGVRRRLSLAELPVIRAVDTLYGFAAVDGRGRVSDKAMPRALGWVCGTRLDIRATGGLLVVGACPDGMFTITGQGYLALPASVRRWCNLADTERVFLAGEPGQGRLIVYPPAALDAMLAASRTQLNGGAG